MNRLRIYRGASLRAESVVRDLPIAIGAAPDSDIRVDDPALVERQWLVVPRSGSVYLYRGERTEAPAGLPLPLDQPVRLGAEHTMVRSFEPPARQGPMTQLLPSIGTGDRLSLVLGKGSEARRVKVGTRPLTIGSSEDCEVVLWDRTVSARHCRLERGMGGVVIRDLGSRNGTYVDGVRVQHAHLFEGSRLRLGRTDLRVVGNPSASIRAATGAGDEGMVARSLAMREVMAEVRRYAALPWPVLLLGESGSGKEVVAKQLHALGARARKPFVALNAGGLPATLVESELFGHERGAFTGATAAHKGAFEQAQHGTLFLDEIGELPLDLQARLLRVIECWEVRRVGSESAIPVDVRLICATHRDVKAMVAAGTFREDLYYRLARLVVQLPPLRNRPDDVIALATHFLDSVRDELGPRELSEEALARLASHAWPGNARELRNVVCAAAAEAHGARIEANDVERALSRLSGVHCVQAVSVEDLRRAVDAHRGNQSAAARALGMPRSTLRDRLIRGV